jgi:hypothetical protein
MKTTGSTKSMAPHASPLPLASGNVPYRLSPDSYRLSPDLAFVVQLATSSGAPRRKIMGRVEHLTSGESRGFRSTADLVEFMRCFAGGLTTRAARRSKPRSRDCEGR